MDNIQKLREKVEKDPKSTVFVRLADELKKARQLDEALEVLKAGIERQPGYMSARVALGKVYMDKEMPDEAKAEFMQVVEAAPDNLFARKKLAELYRTEGDIDLAIEHYKKYLSLNPQDDDVRAICTELKGSSVPRQEVKEDKPAKEQHVEPSKRPSPLSGAMGEPSQAKARPAPPASEQAAEPAPAAAPQETDIDAEDVYLESSPYGLDEAEGFMSSLSDSDTEGDGGKGGGEDPALSLQEKGGSAPGHGVEFKGFDLESNGAPDMMGQDDIDSMIEEVAGVPDEGPEPEVKAPGAEPPPAMEADLEAAPFEGLAEEDVEQAADEPVGVVELGEDDVALDMEEATEEPVGVVELSEYDVEMGIELEGVPMGEDDEAGIGVVEIPEEDTSVELEGFTEPEPVVLAEPEVEPAPPPSPAEAATAMNLDEEIARADALVEREEYGQAFEVYRRLLAGGGGNPEVRQRAEELRGLIKILGKDREITEARLQAFLGSLQRKKHEFFGSS